MIPALTSSTKAWARNSTAGGVFINPSFDEANVSRPKLVTQIHTEYMKAGAEIIPTNTFGAKADA